MNEQLDLFNEILDTINNGAQNVETKVKINKHRFSKTGFNLIIWAITGPVVVPYHYPSKDLVEKYKHLITLERMMILMKLINENKFKPEYCYASDIETMIYLSEMSLETPFDHDVYMIYQYMFKKVIRKYPREFNLNDNKDIEQLFENIGINEDPEELSIYQKDILDRLQKWLFKKSYNCLKIKEKKERRIKK